MKKKVLNIITRLNIGGATIHAVNLTYALEDFDNILVSGQIEPYESDMSYYAKKYNVPVTYIKNMSRELQFPNDLIAFWRIYKLIRREKPDIVHTHLSKAGTLGRIAALCAGVPFVYHTFHGNIFKGDFSKWKIKMFIYIERILAKISTNIIAISEKQKEELLSYKITKADKIKVIKLGFDFSNVLALPEHKNQFRNIHNIPNDTLIIAIIGRITYQKNPKMFIDIAEILLTIKLPTKPYFLIIGDGDMRDDMQSEINKRGLQSNVIITGFVTDLKPVFADVDMVLMTSHFEGTPVAIIEAMANGKIVLSTNVGGISDIVENGVNGFYFDDFNADLFVDKVLEIVEGRIDLNIISEKAKIVAKETFAIGRLVKDMNDLYEL